VLLQLRILKTQSWLVLTRKNSRLQVLLQIVQQLAVALAAPTAFPANCEGVKPGTVIVLPECIGCVPARDVGFLVSAWWAATFRRVLQFTPDRVRGCTAAQTESLFATLDQARHSRRQ
jgi:hypothetical protein